MNAKRQRQLRRNAELRENIRRQREARETTGEQDRRDADPAHADPGTDTRWCISCARELELLDFFLRDSLRCRWCLRQQGRNQGGPRVQPPG